MRDSLKKGNRLQTPSLGTARGVLGKWKKLPDSRPRHPLSTKMTI
jgi:hypothetical protein